MATGWATIVLEDCTMQEWMTASEVAAELKVSPRTILQWAKQGKIPGYRLSGSERITWRFRRADLDAMLTPPSAAQFRRVENAAEN